MKGQISVKVVKALVDLLLDGRQPKTISLRLLPIYPHASGCRLVQISQKNELGLVLMVELKVEPECDLV